MSESERERGSGGKDEADTSQQQIEAIEIRFETELPPRERS